MYQRFMVGAQGRQDGDDVYNANPSKTWSMIDGLQKTSEEETTG